VNAATLLVYHLTMSGIRQGCIFLTPAHHRHEMLMAYSGHAMAQAFH